MLDNQIMVLELGSKGYSCAQILAIAALRLIGDENENLVRAMSGLSQGIGNSGNICGALSGGLCLLSMFTAKGTDFEQKLEIENLLHENLYDWFHTEIVERKNYADNTCDVILDFKHTGTHALKQEVCGDIIVKTWEKCLALLQEYNIDYQSSR